MAIQELQQTIVNDPLLVIAPVMAVATTLFLVYAPNNLGKDTTLWRTIRSLLPYIDDEAREAGFYTTYEISEGEIVGYWNGGLKSLHEKMKSEGFILSPLAAHKSYDGMGEVLSMAYFGKDLRGMSDPKRAAWLLTHTNQLHVTVFEAAPEKDHEYVISAHYEKSAYSPLTAYKHLKGKSMDILKGKVMTDNMLRRYEDYEKKVATLREKDA